jgi:hypothetical protein
LISNIWIKTVLASTTILIGILSVFVFAEAMGPGCARPVQPYDGTVWNNPPLSLPPGASSASDDRLQWGEPKRQMTAVMLDENADEALERAEHRPVQHHRGDFVRMLVNIECTQTAWHVEVNLYGAALPITANGIVQYIFELRPVEGPFALV